MKTKRKSRYNLTLLILTGSILVTSLIGYTIYRSIQSQTNLPGINQIVTGAPITLAFTTPTSILKKNTTFTLPITLASSNTTTKVTAATVKITYNNTKLNLVSITPDSFFPEVLSVSKTTTHGTINTTIFTYAVPPDSGGKTVPTTAPVIANLNFKPLVDNTTANINFGVATKVSAIGSDTNVLGVANKIILTIPADVAKEPSDIVDDPYFDKPGDLVNAADLNKLFSDWKKTGTAAASSNIVDDPDDKGVKIINAHDLNFMFSISQWPK